MALSGVIIAISGCNRALAAGVRRRGLAVDADLPPAQCVLISDNPGAIHAASSRGLVSLAIAESDQAEEFRAAGARSVYRDQGDLLARLDEALAIVSPGKALLTESLMESLMLPALDAARQAIACGEAPIGCALARGDGTVIATAHNEQNATQNKTAHAEIIAFARAAGKVPLDARDLIMASTLEPCVMCTGAAMESAVDTILYGLRAPADAGSLRISCPTSPESQMPRIVGGILANESRQLFEEFMRTNPRPPQARFVEQLLADQAR